MQLPFRGDVSPLTPDAEGSTLLTLPDTAQRTCPIRPRQAPETPSAGIRRATARIANSAPSSAATGPIGRKTSHRKEAHPMTKRTALRHPPPTRPAGLPCRPAPPRSSPGHPRRQDGAPAHPVRSRLGFLTPNSNEPHRGCGSSPSRSQLKEKLSWAQTGPDQSAGTRTMVISLMASFRLVVKGYSEAFFRS